MSLFGEDRPLTPVDTRRRRGWSILVVALVLGLVMSFIPSSYVIEQPGPVFNTLGSQEVAGKEVPVISITGQPTFPTDGALNMLTVSIVGSPSGTPNWAEVIRAYFDPSRAVIPLEAIYPPNVTNEQRNDDNAAQMVDSQQEAVAAALTNLNYSYDQLLGVTRVATGSPADGVLQSGDIIKTVNGAPVGTIGELRTAIATNGTQAPAAVEISRGGQVSTVSITPARSSSGSAPIIGVSVGTTFGFPFDVNIQLANVGGPSAGMMFALGIIDKLTPGSLTGGKDIAGTGTITPDGTVGPIGGIRQKLFGAREAGSTFFLAPAADCAEVRGHIPAGLSVFAVQTLDDSLAVLAAVSSGGDTSSLPTCDSVGTAATP